MQKTKLIKHHLTKLLFMILLITGVFYLYLFLLPDSVNAANWITSCTVSHSATDDPIVFPGSPGASHLHDFMGAKTTNAHSSANSLRSGATNCLTNGDHSSYWTPALFKNGNVRVLPGGTSKHILAYYIGQGGGIQPFPFGLRMVIGNAKATSPAQNTHLMQGKIRFKCGPGSGTETATPPASCSSGILVPIFTFPNCWDGKNLDSADHISHMAYGSGSCPASHPVKVPTLKAFIRYGVGTGAMGPINFSSGPYYTAHMDFFNAWDSTALKTLIDRCLNGGGGNCGQNPQVNTGGNMGITMIPSKPMMSRTPTMMPSRMMTRMPSMTMMPSKPMMSRIPTMINEQIPGDTNADSRVDIADLEKLTQNIGKSVTQGASMGDFDGNGMVNEADLRILVTHWTG